MQGKKKIGEYVIDMGMKIGEGATGKVYLCHHKEDEETPFAVKIIDKSKGFLLVMQSKKMNT